MVYKNQFKDYMNMFAVCTGIFGLFMGLYLGFVHSSLFIALIGGAISGVLFSLIFAFVISKVSKRIEKKATGLRTRISAKKKIICEGPASQKKGADSIGGWMFLTTEGVEFYPHKLTLGGKDITILRDDISGVVAESNLITITAKDSEIQFVVNKANLWKDSILKVQ